MSDTVINEVLECGPLPSLPSVAVELLELTSDANASMRDITRLVRQDQALSAKVLRTVNSSFYGLSQPCGSIDRALKYLGLATVKSIVLGFSLVETTASVGDGDGFDLQAHWRRSIHGASAAREIALRAKLCDPDEAFTGGLFQDVGMLAMYTALDERYAAVLAQAADRPCELCALEKKALGVDHGRIGEELAKRWKLPADICAAIGLHHRGEDGAGASRGLVRAVSLGRMAGEALASGAAPARAREFADVLGEWCGGGCDARELLERIEESSRTLAKVFDVDMGAPANVRQIMSQASERAFELQIQTQRQAEAMTQQALTDGLTGLANRKCFDEALGDAFEAASNDPGTPLCVVFFDADKFKAVNDTHGHAAGDVVLVELGRRAAEAVGEHGRVFRYGGEEFVILLPGAGVAEGEAIAERVRVSIEQDQFDLSGVEGAPDQLPVTVSLGVSSTDNGRAGRHDSGTGLVQEADEAVYEAKRSGRNRVCVHGRGRGQATDAGLPPLIMLVEDDALAATLMKTILPRKGAVSVDWFSCGSVASAHLEKIIAGHARTPSLVVTDLNVPGRSGLELLEQIRASEALQDIPVVMITASSDEQVEADCTRGGAAAFVRKADLCTDLPKWVAQLISTATGAKLAA